MLILTLIASLSFSFASPTLFHRSSLLSRARPEHVLCDDPRTWFDRCVPVDDLVVLMPYFPDDHCAEGEVCFEYKDKQGFGQIDCIAVPRTPNQKDTVTTKLQLGKRKFSADATPNLERIVSVKLQQDIGDASVSAHVMGLFAILSLF